MSLQKEQLPRQSVMQRLAFQRGQKCKGKGSSEHGGSPLTGAGSSPEDLPSCHFRRPSWLGTGARGC